MMGSVLTGCSAKFCTRRSDLLLLLALFVSGSTSTFATPPHPENLQLLKEFSGQLRCPYAEQWLTKGPEQAALDLGLGDGGSPSRGLQQEEDGNTGPQKQFGSEAGGVTCAIAPGPIGGAHQAAHSQGYLFACPNTPAEASPYQWPLRWTAETDSKSMAFGSDDIVYHSKGRVYYRLDNNWKRQDWLYQRGVQRAVGQGLCSEENVVNDTGGVLACRRDSDQRSTMIHRQSKMFFITWKNGTSDDDDNIANIANCTWLDLQIVGNVRPDWFLDARGDTTDTQYLGDQHVYYNGIPKLVKQWRKKDFADQYFVQSMLANPDADGEHWPLILNVPGEGFGDDFLQSYSNHTLLTEQDNDYFLLDQALEAAGGSCPQMVREGGEGGEFGPPTDVEKVPSNLEIDPNSWFSNVYTFSPVYDVTDDAPSDSSSSVDGGGGLGGTTGSALATTAAGIATIGSCYDSESGDVQIHVEFENVAATAAGELPWIAVGYREGQECLMVPEGGDTKIILLAKDMAGKLSASLGSMPSVVKSLAPNDVATIYPTLVLLENAEGYSNVEISVDNTATELAQSEAYNVHLRFQQNMPEKPATMHLMYAIGSSPQLGYHNSRLCFEVTEFPDCGSDGGEELQQGLNTEATMDSASSSSSGTSVNWIFLVSMVMTVIGATVI